MPDAIGRITIPTVINSGQTSPWNLDAKQEQRYYAGIGPRKFQFKHPNLSWAEAKQLEAFWQAMQGIHLSRPEC